jgi:hypothetical protein
LLRSRRSIAAFTSMSRGCSGFNPTTSDGSNGVQAKGIPLQLNLISQPETGPSGFETHSCR